MEDWRSRKGSRLRLGGMIEKLLNDELRRCTQKVTWREKRRGKRKEGDIIRKERLAVVEGDSRDWFRGCRLVRSGSREMEKSGRHPK